MLKKFVTLILLVGLGFILGFLVLEVGFRWAKPKSDDFLQPHPVLGRFQQPGKTGIKAGANFKVPVTINSQGLRDVEHSLEKPSGVYRVAVLGDSFMAAFQVPLEEAFHRQLEKQLQENHKNVKIEVINFGCAGFGTDQEYLALKYLALHYKPDLVILAFFPGNDTWDTYYKKENKVLALKLDRQGKIISQPVDNPPSGWDTFKKYSKAASKLSEKFERSNTLYNLKLKLGVENRPQQKEVYFTQYTPDWEKAWQLTLALLKETKELSEANGSRFLLVCITDIAQFFDQAFLKRYLPKSYDLERPDKILEDFSRREHISYLSLLKPFREYQQHHKLKPEDLHIKGDHHWTPLAHRLAAAMVKEKIEQDQLIKVDSRQ